MHQLSLAQERFMLFYDMSVVHLGKNPAFHGRYKHINVQYYRIHDVLDPKLLNFEKIRNDDNDQL